MMILTRRKFFGGLLGPVVATKGSLQLCFGWALVAFQLAAVKTTTSPSRVCVGWYNPKMHCSWSWWAQLKVL
eukprot:jgi/Chrzof1/14071/Cz08g24040.t1